jgi:hypothetical protein
MLEHALLVLQARSRLCTGGRPGHAKSACVIFFNEVRNAPQATSKHEPHLESRGGVMRYVLPALPVSGPSGNRARRHEAARLAHHQGAARRSGKTRPAVGRISSQRLRERERERSSHSLQKLSLTRAN